MEDRNTWATASSRFISRFPAANRTARFADNTAGQPWTRATISEGLEPAAFPLGVYMQAAVGELADRTQAGVWAANLDAVLFPDAPRPPPFPPAGRPPGPP